MKRLNWLVLGIAIALGGCAEKEEKAAQNLTGSACKGDLSICGYSVIKSTNAHTLKTPTVSGVVYHIDALVNDYTYTDAYVVTCTSDSVCTESFGVPVNVSFESSVRVIQFQETGSVNNVVFKVKATKSGETGPELEALMQ